MAYQYLQFSISAIADYPRFLACLHQGAHGGSLLGDGVAQLSQVLNLDALCFVERLVQDPCDLVDVAADRCKLAVRRVQPRQLVICHDGLAGEVRLHQGCNPAAWCHAFDLASGGGRFHQEARHPHGHARGVGPLHIRFYGLVGVAILAGDGQDDGSKKLGFGQPPRLRHAAKARFGSWFDKRFQYRHRGRGGVGLDKFAEFVPDSGLKAYPALDFTPSLSICLYGTKAGQSKYNIRTSARHF